MKPLLVAAALAIASACTGQYADPNIPIPTTGFGADGPYTPATISFDDPAWPGHAIEIHHPAEITSPVPTIFYSHAFGGNDPSRISGMLDFVARKGYAIVFVPYRTVGMTIEERYADLREGFRLAARSHPEVIDTTRVGFQGHSFGGGASFALADTCIAQGGWGANGAFVYSLAPWYAYDIAQDQLTGFPANVKVLVEVFDDDVTNDHRMAIDLFRTVGVQVTEKDYLLVRSDTLNGYVHSAEHNLPNTAEAFDALDYYAYYRLIDALCAYAWTGDLAAKDVALGHGSAAQVTMPAGMHPLVETQAPVPAYPESRYEFPCTSDQNPRQDHCGELPTTVAEVQEQLISAYPIPTNGSLTLVRPVALRGLPAQVFDACGRLVLAVPASSNAQSVIDLGGLSTGTYVLRMAGAVLRIAKE